MSSRNGHLRPETDLSCHLILEHLAYSLSCPRDNTFECASCNCLFKELQLILRMLELYIFSQVVSQEFGTLCFSQIVKRTWSEETRASRGLAVSKGTWMIRDGDGQRRRGRGKERKRRRGDTRNFVIAFQTTLCTLMDSSNQLITVMTRVHQFALIF